MESVLDSQSSQSQSRSSSSSNCTAEVGSSVEAGQLSPTTAVAVAEAVLDLLECPVCYRELAAPIFQCNNGHAVCGSCRRRLLHCPVCKSWLHTVRALCLEKLVQVVPRRCRYAELGCTQRLSLGHRKHSEADCSYRVIGCPIMTNAVACSWRGPLAQVRQHLIDDHNLEQLCALKPSWSVQLHLNPTAVPNGAPNQVSDDDQFFLETNDGVLVRCSVLRERHRLCFFGHALCPPCHCKGRRLQVRVLFTCRQSQVSHETSLASIFRSVASTVASGDCLVLTRKYLQRQCCCSRQNQQQPQHCAMSINWRVLIDSV